MKTFLTLTKKEGVEFFRSGKCITLFSVFVLFGIMNPLIAKLTPWMMEIFSDSLADSGMIVEGVTADVTMSWTQFFKNIPMALIVFAFVLGGIFTNEYQSGTLVLVITKGVERKAVLFAKALLLLVVWSVGFWLCFWITYGYNALYWDNGEIKNLFTSTVCWWVFGVFIIALLVLFSTLCRTMNTVLLLTAGVVAVSYFVGIVPVLTKYTPTFLMRVTEQGFFPALLVTLSLTAGAIVASVPIFNKKQL